MRAAAAAAARGDRRLIVARHWAEGRAAGRCPGRAPLDCSGTLRASQGLEPLLGGGESLPQFGDLLLQLLDCLLEIADLAVHPGRGDG